MAAIWTAAAPTAAAVSPVQSVRIKFSVQMPSHRAFRRVSLFHFPSFQPPSVLASVSCRWLVCPRLNGREKNKLRIKAMTELVEHKGAAELKLEQVSSVQVAPPRKVAVAARPPETENAGGHSQTFLNIQSEEELVLGIKKEIEAKRLPANAATTMEEVYRNYHNAVLQSGVPNAREIVLTNMATAFDRILLQFEDPFTFSSYHKAIREPFDYYTFGQNYIRPLVDFRNSYVGNLSLFDEMEKRLKQGHNIVLISNHQSEADPAVIALMLETTNPYIAERITYIAGDRVVLDPVCKPFSMGRNLLCVYSKKHIDDEPELTEMKKRSNTRTLKEMALLLRRGGQIIWIAPSGGRDRPDPVTKDWFPAAFDAASVDNMKRLVDHSGVPGHLYPLALLCYGIMPPPPQVEKEIGEKRMIGFHGVGISLAPEAKFNDFAAGPKNQEKIKEAFSEALYDTVVTHYNVLKSAIYEGKGMIASNSLVSLSQPWKRTFSAGNLEKL
eukprot:Gb_19458 [translate_table: standard]